MKILFFTDTHIKSKNPRSRIDDYEDSIYKKIEEIREISINENVDVILHGGDLFDKADVGIKTASRFGKLFQTFPKKVFIISGNHDIYGYNPNSIDRAMMGLFNSLDVLELIEEGKPVIIEKDGLKVQISGQPYTHDIDSSDKSHYYPKRLDDVDYHILMIHSFLLYKKFIEQIEYTLIDQIMDTDCDIVLSGHYHTGFKTVKVNEKYFSNPGSIARMTNTESERKRIPKVLLIELTKEEINISDIYLKSAKKSEEIFSEKQVNPYSIKSKSLLDIKEKLSKLSSNPIIDINNNLKNIGKEMKIDEDIIDEAIRRIE